MGSSNYSMTEVYYRNCDESDKWISEIDHHITKLNDRFNPLSTIIYSGVNALDLLPIKFIQHNRSLLIWKRDSYPDETYAEIIKLFALFPDDYYQTHRRGYKSLLKKFARLQTKIETNQISEYIHDILDAFYMFIMSGKYADRHKGICINSEILGPVVEDMQVAYDNFYKDPFEGIQAKILHIVLETFYGVELKLSRPEDQLTKGALEKIGEIWIKSTESVGHINTHAEFVNIYNFVAPFLDSSVNDLKF